MRSHHGYSLRARGEAGGAVLGTLQERSRRVGTMPSVRGDAAALDFPDLPDRDPPRPSASSEVSAGAAGPAPEPLTEPPAECCAAEVPPDAGRDLPLVVGGDLVFPAGDDFVRAGKQWRGEHEPCDWIWPTSHWWAGEIYRDLVGAGLRGEVPGGEGEIIMWAGVSEPEGRPGEVEPLFALPFTGDR